MAVQDQPCASIYMPVHKGGQEVRQDPIRFRNLLKTAQESLEHDGLRRSEAAEILRPAETLIADPQMWRQQAPGLAVFAASGFFRYYSLPADFDQLVTTGRHFHIKPLLPVLNGDMTFFILALAQKQVRLYLCSRDEASEIELRNTPTSIEEIRAVEVPEESMQWHTETALHTGERPAMFHSQGEGTDDAVKKRKVRYFVEQLQQGVRKAVNGSEAPMVLAGVDYVRAMYRQTNDYPHLVEEGIAGNPELLSADQLRERAWPIVQPMLETGRQRATDRYMHLSQTDQDKAPRTMNKILEAAFGGRIGELFVDVGSHRWGRYKPELKELDLHIEAKPGDEDLLDYAAWHTLRHGGTVWAVEPEELPEDAPAVAILRY
jgi:hypothetical protein